MPRERLTNALQDDEDLARVPADDDVTDDVEAAPDDDDLEGPGDDLPAGEDDPEDLEAEEDEPEPERRPRSRSQARIENVTRANRELRAEVAASQARLAALEAKLAQPSPQAQQEQQRDEEARLALMSPEERMNYRLERTIAHSNQQTHQVLSSVQDQADQTAFRALLKEKPHYAKLQIEVEKRTKALRDKGTPLPREAVLMFLVGEAAVKSADAPRKRTQSKERLQQQETRPSAGRGDVRGDRRQAGGTASALERRLANVRL